MKMGRISQVEARWRLQTWAARKGRENNGAQGKLGKTPPASRSCGEGECIDDMCKEKGGKGGGWGQKKKEKLFFFF